MSHNAKDQFVKLYNANSSPNALRTRAVLWELELEPEIVEIDLRAGDNKTEDFLAINPNGKVPALVDGDLVIWESRAINAYAASLKPEKNLYPADAKLRAVIDQWSYWQAIHLGPPMQRVAFERVQKEAYGRGEPDESAIASHLKTAEPLLDILNRAMEDREWIAGPLSIADFALASTFMLRKPAGISLADRPNVEAWIDRMEQRKSWQRATEPYFGVLKSRGAQVA